MGCDAVRASAPMLNANRLPENLSVRHADPWKVTGLVRETRRNAASYFRVNLVSGRETGSVGRPENARTGTSKRVHTTAARRPWGFGADERSGKVTK